MWAAFVLSVNQLQAASRIVLVTAGMNGAGLFLNAIQARLSHACISLQCCVSAAGVCVQQLYLCYVAASSASSQCSASVQAANDPLSGLVALLTAARVLGNASMAAGYPPAASGNLQT